MVRPCPILLPPPLLPDVGLMHHQKLVMRYRLIGHVQAPPTVPHLTLTSDFSTRLPYRAVDDVCVAAQMGCYQLDQGAAFLMVCGLRREKGLWVLMNTRDCPLYNYYIISGVRGNPWEYVGIMDALLQEGKESKWAVGDKGGGVSEGDTDSIHIDNSRQLLLLMPTMYWP